MINVEKLKKVYEMGNSSVTASNDIDIEFKNKGLYFILGKSGCGKTTLLNILGGLDSYDSGRILVDDKDISKLDEKELDEYRNLKIGIIFQEYNLISDLNVIDNLRVVFELQNWKNTQENYNEFVKKEISEVLSTVDLLGYEKRKINELSGGERQRVAIARALLKKPDIIFADEPTGNLDGKTSRDILEIFKKISKEKLVIIVSHDKESAYKYATTVINMKDGAVEKIDQNIQTNIKYSFIAKLNDTTEKEYTNIDEEKLKQVVINCFETSNKDDKLCISNITMKKIDVDENENASKQKREIVSARNLSQHFKLRLSFLFFRKRIIRLFFTTIILAVTIVLFFSTLYVSFYDKNQVSCDYLEKYKPNTFSVYKNSTFQDEFYLTQSLDYTKGKLLYDELNSISNVEIDKVLYEGEIYKDEKGFYEASIIYTKGNARDVELKAGNMPVNKNDIVITDYIASMLGANLGDEIYIKDTKYFISGIIKTDYIGYSLISKKNYGYTGQFFEFFCKSKYNVCYVLDSNLVDIKNSCEELRIKYSDIFNKKKDNYSSNEISYSTVSNITEDDLLVGRLPKNQNEIVISYSYANENNISFDTVQNKIYSYEDIYNEKYNGYYSENINLNNYFKNGVIIVGIVQNEDIPLISNVYLYDEAWNEIIEDYYSYYFTDYLLYYDLGNYSEFINSINNQGLFIDEPGLYNIREFSNVLNSIKGILYMALFLTTILNFIMIGTFINISVNENKRNIGILRTLGVSSKDCGNIFSIEFYALYLISVCWSIITILIVLNVANNIYASGLDDRVYNIVKLNLGMLIGVILLELVINVICAYVPINKIKRKKPIEILRDK